METSLSQLSQLSCETAVGFDSGTPILISTQMSVDDVTLSPFLYEVDEELFIHKKFTFHVQQHVDATGTRSLYVSVTASKNVQWSLMYQMRVKTGRDWKNMSVVDKDVVEFHSFSKCMSFALHPGVDCVKFEFRTINEQFLPLPNFDEGDISLVFSDGTTLRTYRALLCLSSKYMASYCSDPSLECVEMGSFSSQAFTELLYQIYPTRRCLYAKMKDLAKAANSYRSENVIYRLSKYIIDHNVKPMSLEDRLQVALDLELHGAVEELVFRAAQNGLWSVMISLGFDPKSFFPEAVFKNIVCPAVLAARNRKFMESLLRNPFRYPDYFSETAENDPNNTTIMFRGTPFHVNKGVLFIHGVHQFGYGNNGTFVAVFSKELQNQCALSNITPGDVLVQLLNSLYPGGPQVDAEFLRAAIVFSYDHGWHVAKENMEQLLLLEPAVNSKHYMDQLKFAEKFELKNMLQNCIFRAEASSNEFATELVNSQDFLQLSKDTQEKIIDRICNGWGLEPKYINKLGYRKPTSHIHREIGLMCGGPIGFESARQEATLAEMDSQMIFGQPEELQVL